MNTSFYKKILSLLFFVSNGFSGCNMSSVAPVDEPEIIQVNNNQSLNRFNRNKSLKSLAREIKKGGTIHP